MWRFYGALEMHVFASEDMGDVDWCCELVVEDLTDRRVAGLAV